MKDTARLDDALIAEADRHRHRGDEFLYRAKTCLDWEEAERLKNRASVAYARSVTIMASMTEQTDG